MSKGHVKPYRSPGPRELARGTLVVLALVFVSCNDSGGRRGSPTAPGPSPSVFTFGADLQAEGGAGILAVTVLLDGRDIGAELSHPTGADDHAVANAAEPGIEPGPHVVILRFDRLGSPTATVEVIAGGTYTPPGSSEPRVVFQETSRQEVRAGDGMRFEFEV